MKNIQVQEKWTVLTKYVDFENPEDETKLLEEIVNLWVTIRGFSLQQRGWKHLSNKLK